MKNARKAINIAAVLLPVAVSAQQGELLPLNAQSETPTTARPGAELGGTPNIDVISLGSLGPGFPLRYGKVLQGSERILLNGRLLKAGYDYSMDYEVGVVYLHVSTRTSDTMTAEYRYGSKAAPKSATAAALAPVMRFGVTPGVEFSMRMGMMDRTADGRVIRSNVMGSKNSFSMGNASISGAFFAGDRQKSVYERGLGFNQSDAPGAAEGQEGKGTFLVQSFRSALAGGSFEADIQDISSQFAGFAAAKEAGFSDGQIGQFGKERGLKRLGFGVNNLSLGSAALTAKTRTLTDGDSGLRWNQFGFEQQGLKLAMNSQRVERGFGRFKDITEADRDQLGREVGLERNSMSGEWKNKFAGINFTRSSIADFEKDKGIRREEAKLALGHTSLSFGNQMVEKDFSRFDSLMGHEKAQFGQEAGLSRQWQNLTSAMLGKGTALAFSSSKLSDGTSDFRATDVSFKNGSWSLEHVGRDSDKQFRRVGSMSADEQNKHIQSISWMYGANVGIRNEDRAAFINGSGIERSATKLTSKISGGTVQASNLQLKGSKDKGTVNTVDLATKNLSFNLRKMDLGTQFNELTGLMLLEKERLGTLVGLQRTDAILNLNLGRGRSISASNMAARLGDGQLTRSNFAYNDPKVQFAYAARNVGAEFKAANALVDAEREMLGWLNGFHQQDMLLRLTPTKNLKLEMKKSGASNTTTGEKRESDAVEFDWQMNGTRLAYLQTNDASANSVGTLFSQRVERMIFDQKIGSSRLSLQNVARSFDGKNNSAADTVTSTVAVETQVAKNVSLRTEQTRLRSSDGNDESISANSVQTQVTKQLGVTITELNINRNGDERDEKKRDYGFTYDFGQGVRLTYGYVRHLNGATAGMSSTAWTFGQNAQRTAAHQVNGTQAASVNGTMLGFGNGDNTWDEQVNRMQSFSLVTLRTTKPFNFLGLTGSSLNVASDSASDNMRWLRENQLVNFNTNAGKYSLGFDYRGQVDQAGNRAIDRTFRFATKYSDKAPLSLSATNKQRVLPNNSEFAIRDITLGWRPIAGLEITNSIQTNPEVQNPNVLLGSTPRADRANIWQMNFKSKSGPQIGGRWEELRNDSNDSFARNAGMTLTFFQNSGSPLSLYYGVEQSDGPQGRRSNARYSLTFDQRAGANQTFSFFLGNLSWETGQTEEFLKENWTMRLNYQLRFR